MKIRKAPDREGKVTPDVQAWHRKLIYFACNFFANNNRAEFNKSAANEKANFVAETTVKHILTLLGNDSNLLIVFYVQIMPDD
ncbi:hypothetical protein, partial [Escherichia coli]|uniref:hypothetical protein n=1 Tax=Escherichia coli TaxID=562 RepID=UPI0024DFD0E7